jgi:YfiH family protein
MFMREPQPNRAFEWTQAPWGAILRCIPLSACADHFFTARNLTLRDNPDEWEAVAQALHVPREDLLLVRQVHESTVAIASADRARPWPRPDADAMVSNDPTAAIAVRVADCVPILLAEETGRVVAAVHAGWRGTSKRAVIAAVNAMQSRFGVRPERLLAAIGPSIGPCCYEVGESTRATFKEEGHHPTTIDQWFTPAAEGKFLLDLWRANRDQLEGAGVQPACIYVAELCTKTHADVFHSYRVEGTSAGRLIGAIRAKG